MKIKQHYHVFIAMANFILPFLLVEVCRPFCRI